MLVITNIVAKGLLTLAIISALAPGTASAQALIKRQPLGGYGSASVSRSYGSSMGGTLLPVSGGFGGFIAERSLEPRPMAPAPLVPRQIGRTPIGGQSMAVTPIGGSSAMTGGRYPAFGARNSMGMSRVIRSQPAGRLMVMPQRLASPFSTPLVAGGGG